jgi:hypothetical protein
MIHWIVLTGFLVRLLMVFGVDQIHHPDEIFQYLEQAHRLVFGYGTIPWEYRYGIRSWILPSLIAIPLSVCQFFHLNDPEVYIPVIKILASILSLSVIYGVYWIVRAIASESAGRLAALFACFWYELIHFASKPVPEVLSAYCLVLALACLVTPPNRKITVSFGLLVGLAAIFRFQYLPTVLLLLLLMGFKWKKSNVVIAGIGFLLVIAAAGLVDYLTWGSFFASYYNNYLYNSVYKISDSFGANSPDYFLKTLTVASGGLFPIAVLLSLMSLRKNWILLLCILSVVLPHCLIAHKEHRFIFAAIPFLLMITAMVISDLAVRFENWQQLSKKLILYSFTVIFLSISVSSLFFKIPFQTQVYGNTEFKSHRSMLSPEVSLLAYRFLHQEPDLAAVLYSYSPWYDTGGYYYLHRNVPIYLPENVETISPKDYGSSISHIVCNHEYETILGFSTIARFENLEIRKIIDPPAEYKPLNVDTQNRLQTGVDDRYQPTVRLYPSKN